MQDDTVSPAVRPYRPASHGPLHPAVGNAVVLPYTPAGQLVHEPEPETEY